MKHIYLMKQPVSPNYNLHSILMIAGGGIGISLVLKYQKYFANYLPQSLLFEQPYPANKEKLLIGR